MMPSLTGHRLEAGIVVLLVDAGHPADEAFHRTAVGLQELALAIGGVKAIDPMTKSFHCGYERRPATAGRQ